jgi:threonine dehydrogenase-like Zn-dependent dehydrogenase
MAGLLEAHPLLELQGAHRGDRLEVVVESRDAHPKLPGDVFDAERPVEVLAEHGGPAPVRRFLPELVDLIWNRKIDPGKVFDLTLPLEEVAEGYRAMDERRAIKTLLRP